MSAATDRARRAIDAIFSNNGKAATYTPPAGGAAIGCTVLLDSDDEEIDGVRARAVMRGNIVKVRRAEIPAPARGGVFALVETGETFTVRGDPYHDEDPERLEHTMTAEKTA